MSISPQKLHDLKSAAEKIDYKKWRRDEPYRIKDDNLRVIAETFDPMYPHERASSAPLKANYDATYRRSLAKFITLANPQNILDLISEIEYNEMSLKLRHEADMRAIKMWREESPKERELMWPDQADLIVWLLKRLEDKDGAS